MRALDDGGLPAQATRRTERVVSVTRLLAVCVAGLWAALAAGGTGLAGAQPATPGPPVSQQRWDGGPVENLQPTLAVSATARVEPSPFSGLLPLPGGHPVPLSNERTLTTWANAAYRGPVYAHPSSRAHRIARLHLNTEDGFPEAYVLLEEYVNRQGHAWVRLRLPARPNGQTGWVRRSALGQFAITRWLLVVDRRAERLTAYRDGHRVFSAPVGVGKPSTPTPAGHFWIRERFRVLDPSSPYYPYALGTADYSRLSEWPGGGVVGLHGAWGQPWLIPGHPSHGCIRMHNADIAWLALRVSVGTPLHVI